ncbi:MAG: hypothetical protein IPK80_29130 [Nannocystis sp.]|nr:hypothetical protein [Nannocystis sp.]
MKARRRHERAEAGEEGYLRDLLCLLPSWPRSRVLELAPAYWKHYGGQYRKRNGGHELVL